MKRLIIIIIAMLLYAIPQLCKAQVVTEEAKLAIQKAIMAHPNVKATRKAMEKIFVKKILQSGITRKQMVTGIAIARSAAIGTVTTKDINISIKALGGIMKPDLEYNWKENAAKAALSFGWGW